MAFTEEHPAAVGSTVTNGPSALRLTSHEERDAHWKTSGWRGMNIPLEEFGGNPGTSAFIPDYLLSSWHHVPFEWAPVVGGGLEERYVWSSWDWRRLQREVRRIVMPTVDGIRGHRVLSPGEHEQSRQLALTMLGDLPALPLLTGERVRVKCTGEEGVVTRSGCGSDGLGLYVETDCNIYRNWSADSFERV